ncbi:zinc transporter ZIP1 isoform X2 [Folsomia candida]|uniref:zinc transporter ZIP1 isoform X2 n=1 Tax=Folsomia candida TaxID=158441 RepID=UPI000B8FA717|nr:zinc transporter ZIP1 isoform X2 [Folsomia candida]
MDLSIVKEIVILFLFFIVLFCVFVPVKFAASAAESGVDIFHLDRYASIVSILNCYAAGIFLGTCLLHLFPDVQDNVNQAMQQIDPDNKFPFANFTIAIGFFMLLTIEQIISDIRERNFSLSRPEALPILGESRITDDDDTPSEIGSQLVFKIQWRTCYRLQGPWYYIK